MTQDFPTLSHFCGAPNVPDRRLSGRQMSGAGNVPTAYCLGHLLSREPNFRAPNVSTPIVGRGSAGAKCTTTLNWHINRDWLYWMKRKIDLVYHRFCIYRIGIFEFFDNFIYTESPFSFSAILNFLFKSKLKPV